LNGGKQEEAAVSKRQVQEQNLSSITLEKIKDHTYVTSGNVLDRGMGESKAVHRKECWGVFLG